MYLLYNCIWLVLVMLAWPFLLVGILVSPRYRRWLPGRLGFGLGLQRSRLPGRRPRIWLHALSVGEVTSSQTLLQAMRSFWPDAEIILSVTTGSGYETALKMALPIDRVIPFPLDFYWLCSRVIDTVAPDVFILVETDFWPNFLTCLARRNVPSVLVNGRISEQSHGLYKRFPTLFFPLFRSFACLAMQSEQEADKMKELGVSPRQVKVLGNLKFDVSRQKGTGGDFAPAFFENRCVWLAGSTHPGEEEILFEVYKRLSAVHPDLYMVIAPRQIGRAGELEKLAAGCGLAAVRRTAAAGIAGDVLVLDTMGELAGFYARCDLAFIGGSLVAEGGHNPIEAAVHGKPVCFGPHMDDFAEIAGDLIAAGGARQITDGETLHTVLQSWLADRRQLAAIGHNGARLVRESRQSTMLHLKVLKDIIQGGGQHG